jgi:hypothetical protein
MAGLPASLSVATWFVAALSVVGAIAYWLDYDAELVWSTAVIGSGFALAEWRLARKQNSLPGENHD